MSPPTACPTITSDEMSVVRRIAWVAIRRKGLRHQEHEDFVQHAYAEWCRRHPHFDETRSSHFAFVVGIARHAVADLLDHISAASRDRKRCHNSLDATTYEDGDGPPRASSLGEDAHGRRLGAPRLSPQDRRDLRLDLAGALRSLSPEDRLMCVLLAKYSHTDVAERLEVSTSTLFDRRQRVREEFVRLGLEVYLSPAHRSPRA